MGSTTSTRGTRFVPGQRITRRPMRISASTTITSTAGVIEYELPAATEEVFDLHYDLNDTSEYWYPVRVWKFNPNANTTAFPNGKSISIMDAILAGRTINVRLDSPTGPIVASLVMSFYRWDPSDLDNPRQYIGLANFRALFRDEMLRLSLYNTIVYAAMYIPAAICTALALAMLLNQKVPGMRAFRTILYLPKITQGRPPRSNRCRGWWASGAEPGSAMRLRGKAGCRPPAIRWSALSCSRRQEAASALPNTSI